METLAMDIRFGLGFRHSDPLFAGFAKRLEWDPQSAVWALDKS
jgi:hypothetical protein